MSDYSVVGKSLPRVDAVAKVTGAAEYAADVKLPNVLYGKILRSPHAHARIVRVDTRRAEQLPGVEAVITYKDLPQPSGAGRPIFAQGKVRFAGEAVAAVAASSPEVAQDALDLIEVEYAVLPAVMDPLEAMQPGAPLIHEELKTAVTVDGVEYVNISDHSHDREGNVDRAFARADAVVENTFHLSVVHQCYLEPHAAVASVAPTGKITVWTTTQGHFWTLEGMAKILGVPMTQINVVPTTIGGGFGGKCEAMLEPIAVLLARRAGKPVKIVMTRVEEMLAATPAPRCVIDMKSAARKDGTLTARQARIIWDTGAYAGGGGGGVDLVRGPYRVPNVKVEAFSVYTNKTNPGAYRAPSVPQVAFAYESQMDMLARELGIDPVAFRLKNLKDNRDFAENGKPPRIAVAFKETLQKAAEMAGWGQQTPRQRDRGTPDRKPQGQPSSGHGVGSQRSVVGVKRRGMGVAVGPWSNWAGPSSCVVSINEDGTVKHFSGAVDLTGSDTVLAQIVAEELGVPIESVLVVTGDTDSAPYAAVSGGSRITYGQGAVARAAAREAKERLLKLAAEQLGVKPRQLDTKDGKVFVKRDPKRSMTFSELGRISLWSGNGPIVGRASIAELPSPPVIAAQIAEVEVDTETGFVKLLRLIATQDVGFAINPMACEGQIQGGAVQGVGWALYEGIQYDNNGVVNRSFLDYLLPTAMDAPPVEVGLVELNAPDGPFGAKGIGEPPIIPTLAAIANAIADATGVHITDLPITPERIVTAMSSTSARSGGASRSPRRTARPTGK
ncbi:MAG: xanthine dehydrogenase family protein molybdopterin-binding subunit [Abditibacteriales bacterium]|nr:xanthine dehydrogenase family protein molybdopterin-binding subunit [Abditibacteriales bacterium]MDW8366823.1 xanthine dehydrogenase family protein molybdopterin-binding subunit [Abditibacteriales bacterium]